MVQKLTSAYLSVLCLKVADLRLLSQDSSDPELASLASAEHAALLTQLAADERALLLQLLPKDAVDDRGVVLEVRDIGLCR